MTVNFLKIFWPESSTRIQGVIRFRWIAIIGLFFGVFPLLQVGYLRKEQLPYLMAVMALLVIFNCWTQGVWSKATSSQESRILVVQLLVDLFAAAGLLFVSGSAANPVIFVLCIHAFLGGMLLRGSRSILFGLLVLIVLTILQLETFQDAKITINVQTAELKFQFLTQWILIATSWMVAALFANLLKKQEEHIRHLQERQLKADRLKSLGALTAGFSHQMATPLNILKLRLDRAARKSSELSEIKSELIEAQDSLHECISIFHQMAGIFSNATEGELQKTKIKSLLTDILKAWKQDNPNVQIETHFQEDETLCQIQTLAFAQTVFDLLDNAAEASDFKEVISLRLFTEGSALILEVIDLGKGLSAEISARLGEPFATDKKHGNGLGVYSAQMTAQALGGEFTLFNNASGKGATARLGISLLNAQVAL